MCVFTFVHIFTCIYLSSFVCVAEPHMNGSVPLSKSLAEYRVLSLTILASIVFLPLTESHLASSVNSRVVWILQISQ